MQRFFDVIESDLIVTAQCPMVGLQSQIMHLVPHVILQKLHVFIGIRILFRPCPCARAYVVSDNLSPPTKTLVYRGCA